MKNENETKSEIVLKPESDRMIRHHIWASMAVGLIPLPLADVALLTAVQINMLRKLARAYNIPFSKDKARNILSALIGGGLAPAVSGPLAAGIVKAVPVAGQAIGIVTMPVLAGATTYAVSRVFIQHFESGGTFLTFDPEKVRNYYSEMLKEGQVYSKPGASENKETPPEPEPVVAESKESPAEPEPAAVETKETPDQTKEKSESEKKTDEWKSPSGSAFMKWSKKSDYRKGGEISDDADESVENRQSSPL